MTRLIVVGASGLIGGHLMEAARAAGVRVIGTAMRHVGPGLERLDIRTQSLRTLVPDLGPEDVVYLLSAYVSPAWIYENQDEARRLNLDATRRIVTEAGKSGARIVFMSTDQVFDGAKGDYDEAALPAPLNLYGRMKYEIEQHLLALPGSHVIARTGWNVPWRLGFHCVVEQTYRALLKPGARMAVDNMINVTDIRDTAAGLLRLATRRLAGTYHLVSQGGVVRADLAGMIKEFSAFGRDMHYVETTFATIPYSEPRPAKGFLNGDATRAALDMRFATPAETVARKVSLLDRSGGSKESKYGIIARA